MKNIRVLLFLLLGVSAMCNGQVAVKKLEIVWSPGLEPFKEGDMENMKIIKADSSNIYYSFEAYKFVAIVGSYTSYLAKYDRKTGESTYLNLEPKDKKKLNRLNTISNDTIGNNFHHFSYFHNKSQKKLYIFDESIDLVSLKPNDSIKKIAEIDLSDKGSFINAISLISDNGRLLFRYSCKTNKGIFYGLEVLNNKLEREWGTFQMAQTEKGYNIESTYRIDQDGNVYAIQRNFPSKGDANKHYDRSRVWVVCYPKDGSTPNTLPLILKNDLFIAYEQLSTNKNNQVICAGLYANPGTVSPVGAFSFILEPKLAKINSVQTNAFSLELLTKGADIRKQNKDLEKITKEKDFDKNFTYNLNNIHFREDGGFDLVAEKYFSCKYTTKTSIIYYFYYDDLFVLNNNADGSFKWVNKIPKYEYLKDEYYSLGSYYLYYDKNDAMNFIFNLSNYKEKLFKDTYYTNTVHMQLSKDGKEHFTELISDNEISNSIFPTLSFQDENGEVLLTRNTNFDAKTFQNTVCKNKLVFGKLVVKN